MKRLNDRPETSDNVEHLHLKAGDHQSFGPLSVTHSPLADQELTRLRATVDELEGSLQNANRRVNRLTGERNQLATLLDKRDQQIEQLNRELGGYVSSTKRRTDALGKAARIGSMLAAASTSLRERVRSPILKDPKTAELAPPSSNAQMAEGETRSPLIAKQQTCAVRPILAVLMFGLSKEEIERLLPIVERDCTSRQMMPLCLIDIDAFEVMRGQRMIFEYLPPIDDRQRFDAALHWDLYFQRRLALIRQKWNPTKIVAFGSSSVEMLNLWSSSPFEFEPLPAASGEVTERL